MTTYYDSSVFRVTNIRAAKDIILTPEDATTDHRWKTETPYLVELAGRHIPLHPRHQVLDYGCGIGRISAELIKQYGCSVVGADSSFSMQALAVAYVESEKFMACPPEMLDQAVTPCDHAVVIWVLQHILSLDDTLARIERSVRPGGKIFVVDGYKRCLPSSHGEWVDDGKSARGALQTHFKELAVGPLDPEHTTVQTAKGAYWAVYQRKD